MDDFKSQVKHNIEQLKFYAYLMNPAIPRKDRICRSFSRGAHVHYDFLEKSQWWSPSELENYQNEKLARLIRHAYDNVPYYKNLFDLNKLCPDDIKTVMDLEKIPILTKKIVRENFPQQIIARNIDRNRIVSASTGGSTGEPLIFYRDTLSQDLSWAAMFRFFKWMKYEWGDRIAYFWRTPLLNRESLIWYKDLVDGLQYSWVPVVDRYDAFRVGEKELAAYVERLIQTQPQIFRGYVNVIVAIAKYCKANEIDKLRPKAITTTAEVLHVRERRLLEEQFNCDVYDQYGGGECFAVSSECEQHNGLHINTEHCVVEVLDEQNNFLRKGQRGKIVVTDLDNFIMPFIRYSNGDYGSLKEGTCGCGRGLPLMNPAEGRVFGMLKGKNGKVVHGEFFANLLDEFGWYSAYNVETFEVVQVSSDSLVWYIVCEEHPQQEDRNILISRCKEYFGDMAIDFEFVPEIPVLPSGKRELIRAQAGPNIKS